jgi:hypothetical protein
MRVIIALVVLAVLLSLGGCSHPYQATYRMPLPPWPLPHVASLTLPEAAYAKPLPSPRLHPIRASLKPPPLPPRKSTQARSQMPPSSSQGASMPTTAKHYVVLDAVGNCAVVDAKPGAGLKIIGAKKGYASLGSANEALKDVKAKCKDVVGAGAEAKFEAAQAKAKTNGVETLTRDDIDGLSYEQIKQLRGY